MSSIDVSKIKLFQLRAFVAVAENGSFWAAAAKLNLTQSAVSHAIATLETELGVILFARGRQGAALTFIGTQIIGEVRQLLQSLDRIVEKVSASRGLQSGQVRIASIRSLATHWLPPIVAAFREGFPQINVTLTKCFDYVEVQAALRNRQADIGLMDVYDRAGFKIVEIGTDDYVVLLPANDFSDSSRITWQQMSQFPLIMPAANDQGYAALRDYIARSEMALTTAYEINEDSTIVSLVAQGLGITILPYLAALPVPNTVQVGHLPQPLSRQLGAVILEDGLHSPAVFTFLDTLKQVGQTIYSTYPNE